MPIFRTDASRTNAPTEGLNNGVFASGNASAEDGAVDVLDLEGGE